MTTHNLKVRNFAQIREANIELGDLTVLVGAQGTGKSLVLQWLKTALDGKHIVKALKDAGQQITDPADWIDLIFGQGMKPAWRPSSQILFDGHSVQPRNLARKGSAQEQLFFVPAHRSALVSDGWALPFQRLPPDMPVAARMFSQDLFDSFSSNRGGALFPINKRLKQEVRKLIDDAIFHGGTVALEQDSNRRQLKLTHGRSKLPFMTWTAGQREFTPLLLGLYKVLPSTKARKDKHIEWVVVEEPEMGLHPRAISVFMLLVLDLLWRGYRVVISTHSPDVLTAVWMLQRLQQFRGQASRVCAAFDAHPTPKLKEVAQAALKKTYKVHYLAYGPDQRVRSYDISGLDPGAENSAEADWGGLTAFSSQYADAVSKAVNEAAR
jgi:AAA domain, putative AbiEii toxin, Type IV TA system